MKRTWVAMGVLIGAVSGAGGMDRDALMIDSLGYEMAEYSELSEHGVTLRVENVLDAESENWAILANVGWARLHPDVGAPVDSWKIGLGLKHYVWPVTSVSLTASYRDDHRNAFRVVAGTVGLKQLLSSPDAAIAPWLAGSLSLQGVRTGQGFLTEDDRSFTTAAVRVGGGCDFMAVRNFAFVFSGGLSQSVSFNSGRDYADGVYAAVAMKYFWE